MSDVPRQVSTVQSFVRSFSFEWSWVYEGRVASRYVQSGAIKGTKKRLAANCFGTS